MNSLDLHTSQIPGTSGHRMHYGINPWRYNRYAFWLTPAITGQYKPTRNAQDYSLDNANTIGEPPLLVEVHVPVCKRILISRGVARTSRWQAQHGHTNHVPRPRPAFRRLQYGNVEATRGSGGMLPQKVFEFPRTILRLLY